MNWSQWDRFSQCGDSLVSFCPRKLYKSVATVVISWVCAFIDSSKQIEFEGCLSKPSFFPWIEHSFLASMFTTARGQGWIMGSAPITGVILLVVFAVMFICALQCVRHRAGCYKLFFYTHLLFWPIFVLLVIHSREFWKWVVGPTFLFLCEKLYTLKRYLASNGRTRLISVKIEDEFTFSLTIKRPPRFNFRTGDYVNICFPGIGRIER